VPSPRSPSASTACRRWPPTARSRASSGLVIEASGLDVGLGELCRITAVSSDRSVLAEVVGFHERGVLLMPLGEMDGLHPGARSRRSGRSFGVDVARRLLGRVLNGLGHPIDGLGKLDVETRVPLSAEPPNPLTREMVGEVLETGVRAIDGCLTFGRGQRVGIFAGSGVGKSTLLGMIARQARADVNVIALLGERGREVREFIEHSLGPRGSRARCSSSRPATRRRSCAPAARWWPRRSPSTSATRASRCC
jgi:flagellar biosynthesis/type III secretory pathway ATPase